ncbi:MAG: alpha-ketoglutarate-dependent dioxygenase AlkB [Myxococcales bacterium]|nr:alpha-ketoglutarate-dependent dioxygenase AlkB [Myxococcales bacterium]
MRARSQHEALTPGRLRLTPASWLAWHPDWLDSAARAEVWGHAQTLPWQAREIVLFGRRVMQPRLVTWAGRFPYAYSGQTLPPRDMPGWLATLCAEVARAAGAPFNHVLGNLYRDGQDSMGMHADDEPELGPRPVVATLSLGAARRFVMAPARTSPGEGRGRSERRSFDLTDGSLLVMAGACQEEFRHGLPRTTQVVGPRISLTFRFISP